MPTAQRPYISIDAPEQMCRSGWPDIGQALKAHLKGLSKKRMVLTVECHPGTYTGLDLAALKKALGPDVICQSDDLFLDEQALRQVFELPKASISYPSPAPGLIDAFFDPAKLQALRETIAGLSSGLILVHGVGAHHIWPSDILVYFDVSRWELLQRMRRHEVGNIGFSNKHISLQKRFLRSYFLDWPTADHIKRDLLPRCQFYLEANNWQQPRLIDGALMRAGLAKASTQPLFMAPFFDPEIWNLSDTDPEGDITASFDLHPDHDNFLLKAGQLLIEIPARNLLHLYPSEVLGGSKQRETERSFPFTVTHHEQLQKKEHLLYWHPVPESTSSTNKASVSQHQHFVVIDTTNQVTMLAGFKKELSTDRQRLLLQKDVPRQADWRESLQHFSLSLHDCLSIPHPIVHSIGSHGNLLRISRIDEHWRQRIPQRTEDEARIPHPPEGTVGAPLYNASSVKWSIADETSPVDSLRLVHQVVDNSPMPIPLARTFRVVCHLSGDDVVLGSDTDASALLHAGQLMVLPSAFAGMSWYSQGWAEVLIIADW